jgi:CRISPR/Cas system CSM-associated protein Csm3 (group 7 of RAMP superfamily)
MKEFCLKLTLLSDATFGRGDGVAGLVDVEVQHDAVGLPYLGGRALKGVLGAECDDLIYALSKAVPAQEERWQQAAIRLFGRSGARLEGEAIVRIGPACLPRDLQAALARDIDRDILTRVEVLEMLTTLRRQTAMDKTGAPRKETLRTLRVILRDITFTAQLVFTEDPPPDDLALLSATVKALRRVGTGRNRGRGRVQVELCTSTGEPMTDTYFADFRKAVQG